jgi:multidrug efflux pump subunit AcrB
MRFSRFFIDRPIFAAVVSIVIFIAGLIAMFGLPISRPRWWSARCIPARTPG